VFFRNLSKIKSSCLIFYYSKENKHSLRYLLASLEKNKFLLKNTDFLFAYNENDLKDLLKRTHFYKKRIICFSFFSTQIEDVLKIIGYLKKEKNLIKIIGGALSSFCYERLLKMGFDYAFIGEAEDTFPLFLERIIKEEDINDLEGIAYKKERLFLKRRTKNVDINKYLPVSRYFKKMGHIEITRGCTFKCKFCSTPALFKSMRHRNLEVIFEAVKIMKEFNFCDIRFLSPNAFSYFCLKKTPNLEMIEKLLKGTRKIIKNEGKIFFGSFPSEVRPDFINKEIIKLLKKFVDNDNIIIGAQSGSNRLLKLLNRGHTKEEVIEAVRITKEEFKVYVDIILGFPQENYEDRKETIAFIKELMKLGAKIHLHYFLPLAGTPLFLEKPTPLEKEIRKQIERWEGEGKIFGQWRKQLELSLKLSSLNEELFSYLER